MGVTYLFAGVAVTDLDAAREWYERVFGRPPDLVPNATEVSWELAGAGWIYVVADAARAGSALTTVLVDDLDARLAALAERGIEPGPVEHQPGLFRRFALTDPDGNRLTIAQVG